MQISGIKSDFLNTITSKSQIEAKVEDTSFNEILKKATEKKDVSKLEEAAESFEAYFVYKVLKQMHSSINKSSLFGDAKKSEYYNDMLLDAYSKEISKSGGFGIKDIIISQLGKEENDTSNTKSINN